MPLTQALLPPPFPINKNSKMTWLFLLYRTYTCRKKRRESEIFTLSLAIQFLCYIYKAQTEVVWTRTCFSLEGPSNYSELSLNYLLYFIPLLFVKFNVLNPQFASLSEHYSDHASVVVGSSFPHTAIHLAISYHLLLFHYPPLSLT